VISRTRAGAHALPEGEEKTEMVRSMFDTIAPRYDLVNRVMTFGLDLRWRRRTVRLLGLAPGSVVGDLACGTGDLCVIAAGQGLRMVGLDLSMGMLRSARWRARLAQADAGRLPLAGGSLDGVVSGFAMRNFTDLEAVLAEVARVVRAGGRVAFLDVGTPANPVVGAGHRIWFNVVVPRIGSLLSDREAYRYLPRSVAYLPPREELLSMFGRAGFEDVAHLPLTAGVTQVVTATRRGAAAW
jgi:demethylmenaquinone methyltransferase/2-methoxy-6-polyprenyl-1,4-benzoquinol methylase